MEGGAGVAVGVLALGDRLMAELLAGDAGLEHAPSGRHGQAVLRREEAERFGEGAGAASALPRHVAAPVAPSGTTVDAAIDDDGVGKAGVDGGSGVRHESGADVAGLVDLAEPREIRNAEIDGHFGLGAGVHEPLHQAIDFGGSDASIVEGGLDGLQGERQLGAPAVAGVIGLADPGDGYGIGKRHGAGLVQGLVA